MWSFTSWLGQSAATLSGVVYTLTSSDRQVSSHHHSAAAGAPCSAHADGGMCLLRIPMMKVRRKLHGRSKIWTVNSCTGYNFSTSRRITDRFNASSASGWWCNNLRQEFVLPIRRWAKLTRADRCALLYCCYQWLLHMTKAVSRTISSQYSRVKDRDDDQ